MNTKTTAIAKRTLDITGRMMVAQRWFQNGHAFVRRSGWRCERCGKLRPKSVLARFTMRRCQGFREVEDT